MTDPIVTEDQMPTDEPTAGAPTPGAPTAEDPTAVEAEPMAADEQPVAAVEAPEAAAEPATTAEPEAPTEAEAPTEVKAAPEAEVMPRAAATKSARKPRADATTEPEAEGRKAAATVEPEVAVAPARSSKPVLEGPKGLRIRYRTEVIPALVKQFEYANPNQVPKLEKIVVNVGMGEALSNAKAIDAASSDLTMITGQKPIVTKARRSIAQFKIRTGNPIGLKVTLRGQRMWDFLERLLLLTLPRIRDFRGTPSRSFDGRGNYSLGMREQIAFPEIDYDKVDRLRGLEVSIVTTAKSDEESKRLLELLGMPFAS